MIRSTCRSHQCPRFESFQPLLLLLLDTELTAIMTVRNPLLLHNRFILQLISARICARYTYVYICLQSLLMYPRNICVRFSSRMVGGTMYLFFSRFHSNLEGYTYKFYQAFNISLGPTILCYFLSHTDREGGRERERVHTGEWSSFFVRVRSFDLETGYTDTEASERASVYTRRRRWDTPTCRDISVSCIISFKAFNQCRGPGVI